MHIPKSVLFGLVVVAAAFVGWMVRSSSHGVSATQFSAPSVSPQALPQTVTQPQSVYLMIVMNDSPGNPVRTQSPARATASSVSPNEQSIAVTLLRVPDMARAGDPRPTSSGLHEPQPGYEAQPAPGPMITANGNDIVIAQGGSIVSVGDNTVVEGNTGDAGSSGVIAIDVDHSALTSGSSGLSPSRGQIYPDASGASPQESTLRPQSDSPDELHALGPPSQDLRSGGSTSGSAGRAVGINGYEISSVDIAGNHNFATYNDSNLFYQRTGNLNGNTGDTDTSGLNVVDTAGSDVRTGESYVSGGTLPPQPLNRAVLGPASVSGLLANPAGNGASVCVADANSVATATGEDALVIGGTGVRDRGVRMRGDDNVTTYDDGNATIGGSGNVNSQVGDSASSGAVVMAARDSNIASGGSSSAAPDTTGSQSPVAPSCTATAP